MLKILDVDENEHGFYFSEEENQPAPSGEYLSNAQRVAPLRAERMKSKSPESTVKLRVTDQK